MSVESLVADRDERPEGQSPEDALARLGYAAYGKVTDYKNYQGLPMPTWDALPGAVQTAWRAAGVAIAQSAVAGSKES